MVQGDEKKYVFEKENNKRKFMYINRTKMVVSECAKNSCISIKI